MNSIRAACFSQHLGNSIAGLRIELATVESSQVRGHSGKCVISPTISPVLQASARASPAMDEQGSRLRSTPPPKNDAQPFAVGRFSHAESNDRARDVFARSRAGVRKSLAMRHGNQRGRHAAHAGQQSRWPLLAPGQRAMEPRQGRSRPSAGCILTAGQKECHVRLFFVATTSRTAAAWVGAQRARGQPCHPSATWRRHPLSSPTSATACSHAWRASSSGCCRHRA